MKLLINLLTRNWFPKLISLLIAIFAWFIIKNQVNDSPRLRDSLHKDTWTD